MSIVLNGNSTISGNCSITHKRLLDDIPNIPFAFSDILLYSGLSSSWSIRVKRDSDQKEEYFGWVNGLTDYATANKFCGGGSINITRRINQGTYGGQIIQEVTANLQPKLIIDGDNGLPCAYIDNDDLGMAVPDAPSIFTNDLHYITAFRTKSFISVNDFYGYFGYQQAGYYKYIAHYIQNYNFDTFLLVADAAWPTDLLTVSGQHSVGPLKVVTHSRSGTTMYSRMNGSPIGSRAGVTGNLQLDSNASYRYGLTCNQNKYFEIFTNRFLTASEQDKIEQFCLTWFS